MTIFEAQWTEVSNEQTEDTESSLSRSSSTISRIQRVEGEASVRNFMLFRANSAMFAWL
jgi:hypothetical protein